ERVMMAAGALAKAKQAQGRVLVRVLLALIALAVLAGALAAWWAQRWLTTPIAGIREATVFEVPRGATLRSVADALQARGLIAHPQIWRAAARVRGQSAALKAGEYAITPGLTPLTLLDLLTSGQVVLYSITFIEGSTFADVRNVLATHDAVDAQYAQRSAEEVMTALGAAGVHPEGQFFPDTYRFPRGTTDLELLAIARRRMQTELQAAWDARAEDLPLASAYEALILASIIEKETALDRERAAIA